jgi:hypothetical protein
VRDHPWVAVLKIGVRGQGSGERDFHRKVRERSAHGGLLQQYLKPLPNPPLAKGRELNCSCFPPYQGGTEGGHLLTVAKGLFSQIAVGVRRVRGNLDLKVTVNRRERVMLKY